MASDVALAQSSFNFNNYRPDAPVFDADGNRLFGEEFVAILYGGPTPEELTLAEDTVYRIMEPVPFNLVVEGKTGYFDYPGFVVIRTVPCGSLTWLQVRAWDLRLGATYEEVAALDMGGYGESPLFQAYGGAYCGLPSPPNPMYGLQSFSLRPIPEPGAALLFLLGLPAAFLLARRSS